MEFKVSTDFEGQTVTGKIEEKGVHLSQLLGKQTNMYIPLNIVEDLIEELQSVLYKVEELKEEKTKSDVNDDFQQLEVALENAGKLFGTVINIGGKKTNATSQSIIDAIQKELKDKGLDLL